MRCWKGDRKGGWERRWERVSNGKCRWCRKGVRVLEEGGRGKGRGRGVVSKGRGREIVREKGRRRENWRGRGKGRRGRGRGREKETRLRFSNNNMVQCVTVSNSTTHSSLLFPSHHLQTVWLPGEQSG